MRSKSIVYNSVLVFIVIRCYMTAIVYHNPRCSKSRETVKLLSEKKIDFKTRHYLDDTLTKEEIIRLLKELGYETARQLMRTNEEVYKVLKVIEETDENKLIEILVSHPKLIERPIVSFNGRAIIGRPPENVLVLFD